MKKILKFGNRSVILERSKSAATAQLDQLPVNLAFPQELATLADALNEIETVDVHTILIPPGKVCFTVDKGVTDCSLTLAVSEAITKIFDTDVSVSNART